MEHLLQKHQMPGVDVRILYKGQNVDQERIERACRRQKIVLPSDIGRSSCLLAQFGLLMVRTVQPSHIEVQVIPVPAFSPIPGTSLSRRGHPNDSVIKNTGTINNIERQACRRTLKAQVQDDETP